MEQMNDFPPHGDGYQYVCRVCQKSIRVPWDRSITISEQQYPTCCTSRTRDMAYKGIYTDQKEPKQ